MSYTHNYTFKSSGITNQIKSQQAVQTTIPDIGIKTPLSFGHDSFFVMNKTLKDQVRDNLKNLLKTNHGERVGKYTYGANLAKYLTERIQEENYDSIIEQNISKSLNEWLPVVQPKSYAVEIFNENPPFSSVKFILIYDIPGIGVSDEAVEVIFGNIS